MHTRIIPCLLLKNDGLVKTVKFKNPKYIGDPINAIKIFNEKEVDELIFLDILATKNKKINYQTIENIAGECFMPLSYGGGITNLSEIEKILKLGVEKVVINSSIHTDLNFISEACARFGSSTIVASIDYKKNIWGKNLVYSNNGNIKTNYNPFDLAKKLEKIGVGEIMINSIERDGMMNGVDIEFWKECVDGLSTPIIGGGGVGTIMDLKSAIDKTKIAAIAVGSLFVYYGPNHSVLINYPSQKEILALNTVSN
jgi:cyclase